MRRLQRSPVRATPPNAQRGKGVDSFAQALRSIDQGPWFEPPIRGGLRNPSAPKPLGAPDSRAPWRSSVSAWPFSAVLPYSALAPVAVRPTSLTWASSRSRGPGRRISAGGRPHGQEKLTAERPDRLTSVRRTCAWQHRAHWVLRLRGRRPPLGAAPVPRPDVAREWAGKESGPRRAACVVTAADR